SKWGARFQATLPCSNCRYSTIALTSFKLAQRSKAGPELLREKLRLFPGGKMSAFGDGVEMEEVVIRALRPTPRALIDLLGENADGGRNRDVQVVEKAALEFRVEAGPGHS